MKVLGDYGAFFKRWPEAPQQVPMELLSEEWAQRNHSQTLDRLNERGGLSIKEMVAVMEKKYWREINMLTEFECIQKVWAAIKSWEKAKRDALLRHPVELTLHLTIEPPKDECGKEQCHLYKMFCHDGRVPCCKGWREVTFNPPAK